MYTPTIITDSTTGRYVIANMFEQMMYESGDFTFEDLWEINQPLDAQEELDFTQKAVMSA